MSVASISPKRDHQNNRMWRLHSQASPTSSSHPRHSMITVTPISQSPVSLGRQGRVQSRCKRRIHIHAPTRRAIEVGSTARNRTNLTRCPNHNTPPLGHLDWRLLHNTKCRSSAMGLPTPMHRYSRPGRSKNPPTVVRGHSTTRDAREGRKRCVSGSTTQERRGH